MKSAFTKVIAAAVAANFFKTYPSVETFHVTEDEQVFENANDALNNAKMLDNKDSKVWSVTRDESAVALDEQSLSDNPKLKTGEKTAVKAPPATDNISLKDTDKTQVKTPDNTVTSQAGGDDAALSKIAAQQQEDNAAANAKTAEASGKKIPPAKDEVKTPAKPLTAAQKKAADKAAGKGK